MATNAHEKAFATAVATHIENQFNAQSVLAPTTSATASSEVGIIDNNSSRSSSSSSSSGSNNCSSNIESGLNRGTSTSQLVPANKVSIATKRKYPDASSCFGSTTAKGRSKLLATAVDSEHNSGGGLVVANNTPGQ